jgi:hypothetical protein
LVGATGPDWTDDEMPHRRNINKYKYYYNQGDNISYLNGKKINCRDYSNTITLESSKLPNIYRAGALIPYDLTDSMGNRLLISNGNKFDSLANTDSSGYDFYVYLKKDHYNPSGKDPFNGAPTDVDGVAKVKTDMMIIAAPKNQINPDNIDTYRYLVDSVSNNNRKNTYAKLIADDLSTAAFEGV